VTGSRQRRSTGTSASRLRIEIGRPVPGPVVVAGEAHRSRQDPVAGRGSTTRTASHMTSSLLLPPLHPLRRQRPDAPVQVDLGPPRSQDLARARRGEQAELQRSRARVPSANPVVGFAFIVAAQSRVVNGYLGGGVSAETVADSARYVSATPLSCLIPVGNRTPVKPQTRPLCRCAA
jgi:hypothetical protein